MPEKSAYHTCIRCILFKFERGKACEHFQGIMVTPLLCLMGHPASSIVASEFAVFVCCSSDLFIVEPSFMLRIYTLLGLQRIPGVVPIKDGQNPASWMLETTSAAEEERFGVDFAEVYQRSPLAMYASLHELFFKI